MSESSLLNYYEHTAQQYDQWHTSHSEHNVALHLISGLISALDITSVLDTGCGTGRGYLYLAQHHPQLKIYNSDLSSALLNLAVDKGVPTHTLCRASSYALPYTNDAFDLTIELGALHHVANPKQVVTEMWRVSRIGIAMSDSNMYAAGIGASGILSKNLLGALLKVWLARSGILKKLKLLRYGREYSSSPEDGIFYTFSIFEILDYVRQRQAQIFTIPLQGSNYKDSLALLGALHCLIIALKPQIALE